MKLAEVLERVPNSVLAAWIDSRTGATLEKQAAIERQGNNVGLEAVTEIVCSPDRPRRMVLMSADAVFIAQRPIADSHRVLVVMCNRTPNLGLSVVLVGLCASDGVGGGA